MSTLKDRLRREEGFRAEPYVDTNGYWTVGYGHCIHWNRVARYMAQNGGPRVTHEQAEMLLECDVRHAVSDFQTYFEGVGMNHARREALIEMAFCLGLTRLGGFVNMIAAVRYGDWVRVGAEALDSDWARDLAELGSPRAKEIANVLREGEQHETDSTAADSGGDTDGLLV